MIVEKRSRRRMPTAAALGLLLACSTVAVAETYQIDKAHSFFMFRSLRMGVANIYGRFNDFEGTVDLEGDDFENGGIEITVRTDSVDTGEDRRDAHLRSPDFLNASEIPTMKFSSKSIKKTSDSSFEVTGDLSLHGVTKEVTAQIELVGDGKDPRSGSRLLGFDGVFTIQRSDFGMEFMPAFIGADVDIHFAIQVVSQ